MEGISQPQPGYEQQDDSQMNGLTGDAAYDA